MSSSQCCPLLECIPWSASSVQTTLSRPSLSPRRVLVKTPLSAEETLDPNQISELDSQSTNKISFLPRVGSFPQSIRRLNSLNTDIMAQEKSLKKQLAERRVDMTYDKERMSQTWLPFNAIEDILGSEKGRNSLRTISGDKSKLLTFVGKSKRLWALLVHVNRLGWLGSFCDADFDDSLFPIKRSGNWKLRSRSSNKFVVMPGKSDDDETAFDSIEDQQWQFFVPIFGPKTFACGFDYHCRMPFIREFRTEDTNFSAVTEYVIHRKHLDFSSNDQIVRDKPAAACSGN